MSTPANYTAYPYSDASDLLEAAGLREKTINKVLEHLHEPGVRALAGLATTGAPLDVITWLASLSLDGFARTLDMKIGADATVARENLRVIL